MVVNLRTEDFDRYIGRKGRGWNGYFGNPVCRRKTDTRGATLDSFRAYFYKRLETDDEFRRLVNELKGLRLGCFCKPNPCHGDVIAEYLNRAKDV